MGTKKNGMGLHTDLVVNGLSAARERSHHFTAQRSGLFAVIISLTGALYSFSCLGAPITYNYSNGGLADNTLIDSEGFGPDGDYQINATSYGFTLDIGETNIGHSAFVGGIFQPSSGSGSGTFFFNNVPMTINGLTQGYNFPGTYTYQIDPFVPTVFTFTSLPDVVFDLGGDGMLVGTWLNDTVTCSATGVCGGGVFPFITFTRQAAGVPEPATFALMGLGLAGLGFTRRKKA